MTKTFPLHREQETWNCDKMGSAWFVNYCQTTIKSPWTQKSSFLVKFPRLNFLFTYNLIWTHAPVSEKQKTKGVEQFASRFNQINWRSIDIGIRSEICVRLNVTLIIVDRKHGALQSVESLLTGSVDNNSINPIRRQLIRVFLLFLIHVLSNKNNGCRDIYIMEIKLCNSWDQRNCDSIKNKYIMRGYNRFHLPF